AEVKKEAPKAEAPMAEVKKEAPKVEAKKGANFQYAPVSSFFADDYKVVAVDDQIKETIVPLSSKPLPRWEDPAMKDSNWRFLDLAKTVKFYRGNTNIFDQGENLGNYQDKVNGRLGADALPEGLKVDGVEYSKKELDATFAKIVDLLKEKRTKNKAVSANGPYDINEKTITRGEYLSVQRHDWGRFFTWPACFIAFWVFVFVVFGREPEEYKEEGIQLEKE
ncbi:MAG: hypothetical protein Q4G69_13945, partial [Planctomycetia bacterium]|nr:hypothetical protein [Planctomycetia bacterium]